MSADSFADHPATVAWEVTRGAMSGCSPSQKDITLPHRVCLDIVDQIAATNPRLLLIAGDLIARPDIVDLVARADAHGLRVALRPAIHSALLDFDFQRLCRVGVRSLSIDFGHSRVPGSGRRIALCLDVLAAARRARIAVQIKTTTPDMADLPHLASAMRTLNPDEWRIATSIPHRGEQPPDAIPTEELLTELSRLPADTRVPLQVSDAPHYRRIAIRAHTHPRQRRIIPINDGRGRLFISHRGEIQPGARLPIACGNVQIHHLLDVYRDAKVFRRLRDPDLLRGKCGNCGFRLVCGGSRARAYAAKGDYLAADPSCAFQPQPAGAVVNDPLFLAA